jgi:hypothetical protein
MFLYNAPDDRYRTGLAENRRRALADGASSMLRQCAGTLTLWPLALQLATHLLDRLLCSELNWVVANLGTVLQCGDG